MKNYILPFSLMLVLIAGYSCENISEEVEEHLTLHNLQVYKNTITIDSMYTYPEDSLYKSWAVIYNAKMDKGKTRALSPEDEAFFSKKYAVKSTESILLYGKNYIYPGAILEGNSITDQKYVPVFINNRNPITVSINLTHNSSKPTSRTINSPSFSKLDDYVKEMVVDGNFAQNQKFMFQYKRFSFYDEIKTAFGTNVNTRKLFSSKKESSTEEREKIVKSTGMYVKFFQSSFTVNMDIAPLSNQLIKGNTLYEPVYVSSLTYGRVGYIVFETDETYEFAETCIKKEFDRIFHNKETTLSEKEKLFYETTDFKILILGGDSDYSVQTIRGYSHFLNLIYNSQFTQNSYGVPVACSFSYANSHGLVEAEFENFIHIEPLFVKVIIEDYEYRYTDDINYYYSGKEYLNFYKDREGKNPAYPNTDITFVIRKSERQNNCSPDKLNWKIMKCKEHSSLEYNTLRNINFKSKIFMGDYNVSYSTIGKMPTCQQDLKNKYEEIEFHKLNSLEKSPFFILL